MHLLFALFFCKDTMDSSVIMVVVITSLASTCTPTEINNLIVPELVQLSQNDVVLDCTYTIEDRFVLQWLFNNSMVYEWSPGEEPKVGELLEGRIDLSYRPSLFVENERRALHITKLDPELSGEYTCQIVGIDRTVRMSKNMLIYSPEEDFFLEINRFGNDTILAKCMATRLFPQPELILQLNNEPIRLQAQRLWRKDDLYYEAKCEAVLTRTELMKNGGKPDRISCVLHLPQAGYTAIRDQHGPYFNDGSCPAAKFILLFLLASLISVL